MPPKIHKNALKRLDREEALSAWGNIVKSIQRASDDEPPRRPCAECLPDGRSVELTAVETVEGWLVVHANSPIQAKFANEIRNTERRAR
ncbi:hypothetical protein [Xiamenia xianingshaonis]|uniref:Uncharacterized protein n=1 Tax=Xiamenia xianingshaonis TaxID=2682776 RepID=A0ABX0IKW3_9ACTN|nr:hypothetical protein [Xiamenia xianingshaonis]NHM13511.1 hypothetical protein [Xiamenia xianingshaonis]